VFSWHFILRKSNYLIQGACRHGLNSIPAVTEHDFHFPGFSSDSAVLPNVLLMFTAINPYKRKHIFTYTDVLTHSIHWTLTLDLGLL